MNHDRFNKVIEIAEAVPVRKFNMWFWRNASHTAGCPIGWYCMKLAPDCELKIPVSADDNEYPVLGDKLAFEAIALHFEISDAEAVWLFGPCAYDSASQPEVIGRLKAFFAKQATKAAGGSHEER